MCKYPENQRFKIALKFLLEQKKVKNKSDFAKSIGIQVQLVYDTISEKLKLSSEILEKSELIFGISKIWMQFGEGEMLKSLNNLVEEQRAEYRITNNESVEEFNNDVVVISREVFNQISKLTETVLSQQRTIENLSVVTKRLL